MTLFVLAFTVATTVAAAAIIFAARCPAFVAGVPRLIWLVLGVIIIVVSLTLPILLQSWREAIRSIAYTIIALWLLCRHRWRCGFWRWVWRW